MDISYQTQTPVAKKKFCFTLSGTEPRDLNITLKNESIFINKNCRFGKMLIGNHGNRQLRHFREGSERSTLMEWETVQLYLVRWQRHWEARGWLADERAVWLVGQLRGVWPGRVPPAGGESAPPSRQHSSLLTWPEGGGQGSKYQRVNETNWGWDIKTRHTPATANISSHAFWIRILTWGSTCSVRTSRGAWPRPDTMVSQARSHVKGRIYGH